MIKNLVELTLIAILNSVIMFKNSGKKQAEN